MKTKQQNQTNIEKLSTEIANSNLMDKIDMSNTADPNDNYNIINTIIGNAIEKHIPEKVIKFNNNKHKRSRWITKGIVNSIVFRDKLYCRLKTYNHTLWSMKHSK